MGYFQWLQQFDKGWRSAALAAASFSIFTFDALPTAAFPLVPVKTELSLLIDNSGSISNSEFNLQMQGYQTAWANLAPKFETGELGKIAVNVIMWASSWQQQEVIPWTLIDSPASALQFAAQIGSTQRSYFGTTAPGSALNFAVPLFSSNAYIGDRWVIDVSGDGQANSGFNTALARNNALANGVTTINGLPILGETGLQAWYAANVIGGKGAFVEPAKGFEDFDQAIAIKLERELAIDPPDDGEAVPEPSTMAGLLLVSTLGTWAKRRHSRKAELEA